MAVTCFWWTVAAALCSWVTCVILWSDRLLGRNLSGKGPICFCWLFMFYISIGQVLRQPHFGLAIQRQTDTSHLFPIFLFLGGFFCCVLDLKFFLSSEDSLSASESDGSVDEGKISFISLFFPLSRCLPSRWDLNCYLSSLGHFWVQELYKSNNRGIIS